MNFYPNGKNHDSELITKLIDCEIEKINASENVDVELTLATLEKIILTTNQKDILQR